MKTAQAVARYLREIGVRRAFGVPGGELVELIEAFRREDIAFLLTHHEAPAAFMAAATGEPSGAPGVCLATRGPGAVNLFAGVATAFVDRRPLIAITGDHTPAAARRDTHQQLPLVDLYSQVTRLSAQLTAENVGELLPKAVARARGPRPGPVFLPIPGAAATEESAGVRRQAAADEVVPAAACRLTPWPPAAGRRPLIMAGLGLAANPAAAAPLRLLAERWGCPVMVTPQVKGYFPEDHPLFAGVFGMYRDEPLHALMEAADLIVAVGLGGVDFFKRWRTATPVLSLAAEGAADVTYQPAETVEGPLDELLVAAAAARAGRPTTRPRPAKGSLSS